MKIYNKKSKAFTLLEVLIASAIFAVILVMTTGTVSLSSGYQKKLSNTRKTSSEASKISDQLSTDIRSANYGGKVNNKSYSGGIALANCKPGVCSPTITGPYTWNPTKSNYSNTLVIFAKEYTIIYYTDNSSIYYGKASPSVAKVFLDSLDLIQGKNPAFNFTTISVSGLGLATSIIFTGYAPDNAQIGINPQQPFVSFDIITSTNKAYLDPTDYLNTSKLNKDDAISEILSSVTSRNYAR